MVGWVVRGGGGGVVGSGWVVVCWRWVGVGW